MSERKPLTLEELRDMVGKPVWVETKRRKEWCILWGYHGPEVYGRAMIFTTRTAAKNQLTFADYGKTWIAYATDPTRLDRSAWEPCDFCEKELDDYPYIVAHSDYDESNTCYTPAFCPVCGRPLTDAAWAMLERRLAGREN